MWSDKTEMKRSKRTWFWYLNPWRYVLFVLRRVFKYSGVRFLNFIVQRVLGVNDDIPWSVHYTSQVSGDIEIAPDVAHSFAVSGNCYIQGGLVYAIGTGNAEKSIDANTEQGKKLYITGGTIIAVGDLENGSSISGGTCKYTSSWNATSWYALYNGDTQVAAFKTPTKSSSGGGGWPGGGPGGGGNNSQKLIVYTSSTPTLQSGITVSEGTELFDGMANINGTINGGSSVSLSNYTSSGGGPGGW